MKFSEENRVSIKRLDEDQQIVYGEVYAPNTIDTYGDAMTAEDVKLMAERFMEKVDKEKRIDTNHNNISNGSYPIESFIAEKDDPYYTEGAWVLGVKVDDPKLWEEVKSGKYAGYSFEGVVKMVPAIVEVIVAKAGVGKTEQYEDHHHLYFLEYDDEGRVKSGRTSQDLGHSHEILRGTATEKTFGHSHRMFL